MKRAIERSYDPNQPSNDTNHPSSLALFYTSMNTHPLNNKIIKAIDL
jgi:hypothetical protein